MPIEHRMFFFFSFVWDKVVTRYKDTWLTGWTGRYALSSAPETLTFLYNAGLGQRNTAGFGIF